MIPLIAANWKMHGRKDWTAKITELQDRLKGQRGLPEILICPPSIYLGVLGVEVKRKRISLGGQSCHFERDGAFTGDMSAEMYADMGADYILCGHSERRQYHDEGDSEVRDQCLAVWRAGLTAVVCIGETEGERASGNTTDILDRQLKGSLPEGINAENCVIAYEPVWAIGTGRTPTLKDIRQAHSHIRNRILKSHGRAAKGIRLLYGGSVKPANAADILALPDVDGALVGGASLEMDSFLKIIEAAPK